VFFFSKNRLYLSKSNIFKVFSENSYGKSLYSSLLLVFLNSFSIYFILKYHLVIKILFLKVFFQKGGLNTLIINFIISTFTSIILSYDLVLVNISTENIFAY
jgi:hypothetical protein